jgi:hypothetical protein
MMNEDKDELKKCYPEEWQQNEDYRIPKTNTGLS